MDNLSDLIERLEKARGPDRELDGLIYGAINNLKRNGGTFILDIDGERFQFQHPTLGYQSGPGALYVRGYEVAFYTASLDASLTLVPEEWGWCVGDVHGSLETYLDSGRPWAEIWKRGYEHVRLDGMLWDGVGRNGLNANTPALALCIAALKARASVRDESRAP